VRAYVFVFLCVCILLLWLVSLQHTNTHTAQQHTQTHDTGPPLEAMMDPQLAALYEGSVARLQSRGRSVRLELQKVGDKYFTFQKK
jgi:hypothetical protein